MYFSSIFYPGLYMMFFFKWFGNLPWHHLIFLYLWQIKLGKFMIMPNHFHGIISITVGARHAVPQQEVAIERFGKPVSGSLSTIVRSFKSATTKAFHEFPGHAEESLWQRSFYEHVIRNESNYNAIFEYIIANPINWDRDEEYWGWYLQSQICPLIFEF